jgi:hypothetical protein
MADVAAAKHVADRRRSIAFRSKFEHRMTAGISCPLREP